MSTFQIRASSSNIASNCSQFVQFLQVIPKEKRDNGDRSYTKEGTRLHNLVESQLISLKNGDATIKDKLESGELEGAAYTLSLYNFIQKLESEGSVVKVETELEFERVIFGGRVDVILTVQPTVGAEYRIIVDFKTGHISVSPDSPQMVIYAYLTNAESTIIIQRTKEDKDVVTLKQRIITQEMIQKTLSVIQKQVDIAHQQEVAVSGSHCQFCPFKTICPKMRELMEKVVEYSNKDEEGVSQAWSDESLAFFIENKQALSCLIKVNESNLEAVATRESEIAQESIVKGYELSYKEGNQTFTEEGNAFLLENNLIDREVKKSKTALLADDSIASEVEDQLYTATFPKYKWVKRVAEETTAEYNTYDEEYDDEDDF